MILTMVYKDGRILSIDGVDEVDSKEREGDGGFDLNVSTLYLVDNLVVPTEDLQQWTLMTDMGARVVEISLRTGVLNVNGVEIQPDAGTVPK